MAGASDHGDPRRSRCVLHVPDAEQHNDGIRADDQLRATTDGRTPSAGLNLSGPYSLVDPYPGGLQPASGASLGLTTNIGRGVSFDPPNFKIPRTYQYSFGIQQQLPWNILAEVVVRRELPDVYQSGDGDQ